MTPRAGAVLALVLGGLAVVAATVLGGSAAFLDAVVHPPAIIRAALVGASVAIAVLLLLRAFDRLGAGATDVPGLIRGVRLVFLAIAALVGGRRLGPRSPAPAAHRARHRRDRRRRDLVPADRRRPGARPRLSAGPTTRGQSVLQVSPFFGTVSASR